MTVQKVPVDKKQPNKRPSSGSAPDAKNIGRNIFIVVFVIAVLGVLLYGQG